MAAPTWKDVLLVPSHDTEFTSDSSRVIRETAPSYRWLAVAWAGLHCLLYVIRASAVRPEGGYLNYYPGDELFHAIGAPLYFVLLLWVEDRLHRRLRPAVVLGVNVLSLVLLLCFYTTWFQSTWFVFSEEWAYVALIPCAPLVVSLLVALLRGRPAEARRQSRRMSGTILGLLVLVHLLYAVPRVLSAVGDAFLLHAIGAAAHAKTQEESVRLLAEGRPWDAGSSRMAEAAYRLARLSPFVSPRATCRQQRLLGSLGLPAAISGDLEVARDFLGRSCDLDCRSWFYYWKRFNRRLQSGALRHLEKDQCDVILSAVDMLRSEGISPALEHVNDVFGSARMHGAPVLTIGNSSVWLGLDRVAATRGLTVEHQTRQAFLDQRKLTPPRVEVPALLRERESFRAILNPELKMGEVSGALRGAADAGRTLMITDFEFDPFPSRFYQLITVPRAVASQADPATCAQVRFSRSALEFRFIGDTASRRFALSSESPVAQDNAFGRLREFLSSADVEERCPRMPGDALQGLFGRPVAVQVETDVPWTAVERLHDALSWSKYVVDERPRLDEFQLFEFPETTFDPVRIELPAPEPR